MSACRPAWTRIVRSVSPGSRRVGVAALTLLSVAASGVPIQQVVQPPGPPPASPSAWSHPSGPRAVVMVEDPALPDHTIYRPEHLDRPHGRPLPVVAFSGPGCELVGDAFRPFFTELASYGYVVVASGPPLAAGRYGPTARKTDTADLAATIDWAGREASRAGSPYRSRIDPSRIAVMGQSCGGIQAIRLARDPRVRTIVMWNSGLLKAPPPAGAVANLSVMRDATDKTLLEAVHVPIAYFVGSTDIARPNAEDDVDRLAGVPVFLGVRDIPGDAHAGTFRADNGGPFGTVGVAWLDWQLKGDRTAARLFAGPRCGLCGQTGWSVRSKNLSP